eukprot:2986643-Lingulodinium_polyedra.AAC.1
MAEAAGMFTDACGRCRRVGVGSAEMGVPPTAEFPFLKDWCHPAVTTTGHECLVPFIVVASL